MQLFLELLGVAGTWLSLLVGAAGGGYLAVVARSNFERREKIHKLLRAFTWGLDAPSTVLLERGWSLGDGSVDSRLNYVLAESATREIYSLVRLLPTSDRALFDVVASRIPRPLAGHVYHASILMERVGPGNSNLSSRQALAGIDMETIERHLISLDPEALARDLDSFRSHLEYHIGNPRIGERIRYRLAWLRSFRSWRKILEGQAAQRLANPLV